MAQVKVRVGTVRRDGEFRTCITGRDGVVLDRSHAGGREGVQVMLGGGGYKVETISIHPDVVVEVEA